MRPRRADVARLFFITCISLVGCAALPPRVEGELVPPSESPGSFKRWSGIQDSGISEDCGYHPMPAMAYPKGKKGFFQITDKQVTWWVLFKPAALGFIRLVMPSFVSRWYSPDGNLYWEETFPGDPSALFAKNALPIAGTPAETFPGRWRVQVYYEGRLIDEKEFIVNR